MRKLLLLVLLLPACSPPRPEPPPRAAAAASAAPAAEQAPARIQLVESVPLETELGSDALADTGPTWLEMIGQARSSIELCHFYASSEPGGALEPVIEALEAAVARSVRVRMLVDARLGDTYAGTLERLAGLFELRRWDASLELGGIQHAKYMIVDEAQLFVGSANFDWRSLSHIHEIGVRLEAPAIARELGSVFELDWVLAAPGATPRPALAAPAWSPVELDDGQRIELVASPRGWLLDESAWELEPLLALIAGARERLSIELLEYDAAFRDGSAFATLDDALRAAAARGVKVRLLLSNWQLRHPEAAQSLQQAKGIEVAIVTIPPHASGFIPFARVIHAKYAVADGEIAWIGSSNWQGDYFHLSRNVGVVVRGRPIASQLEAIFARLAESPHATPLDPAATYEAPRVGP